MHEVEATRLSRLARAVRGSTLKRLERVPEGAESWRPAAGAMSFADLASHLLDADHWLLRKLADPGLPGMKGEPGKDGKPDRRELLRLSELLRESGSEREALISSLDEGALNRRMADDRFGGAVTVWWIIVRGNLDHEAHHRGQIATYLRILAGVGGSSAARSTSRASNRDLSPRGG